MEVVKNNQLLPGDPRLIDHIVSELKSQGIFDQFRKECIADVDTKPAYQNLRQRVEGNVANFLNLQKWKPDMNKNQLREMLRKNIQESGYLDTGVERIVDQVVNPKISTIFFPQVEDVVYKFLGIEKPEKSASSTNSANGLSVNTAVDLLPTDLDPISPASDKSHNKSTDTVEAIKSDDNNDNEDNDKLDDSLKEDDESPPFEPIEDTSGFLVQDESSVDSHLSGISGLTSHDSNSNPSSPKNMATLIADVSNNDNNDSDLSKVSSDSCLSVVTSDGKSSPDDKMVICDDNSSSKNSQINNVNQDSHSSSEHSLRIDLEQNSNDEVDNRNEMKAETVNIKQESVQDISENAVNGSDMEKSNEKHFEIDVPAEKDSIVEQADIRENSVEKVNSIDSEKNEEAQTKSRRRSRHSENKDRRSDRDRRSDKDRRDRHDSSSRDKYKESKSKDKSEKEKNYSKEYLKELSTDSSESTAQDKNKEDKLREKSEKSRDDKSRDERSKDRTDKIKDEKSKEKEKSKHSRDSDSKSRDDKHKSRSSSKHGSSKSSSRRDDRRDSSKDYHESRDKSKYSSKDSKSSSKIDKDDGKRDSSRDSKHSESKSKSKETKHSKDGKDKDLKDSKDGKENKDKEKDGKETDSKHKGRNRTRSESTSQNSHRKSSSSHDRKDKDKKKDADVKKNSKDDHFSSKDKTSDSRRSTDRDSNDGSSGTSNKNSSSNTNSQSQSKRSQGNSRNSDNTSSGSNSRDSGQSDKMLAMQVVDIFQAKLDEANNIMYKKLKSPSKAVTLDLSDSEFTISPASNIIQNKIMQNKRQLSFDECSDNSEQKSPKRQKADNEQMNEELKTNEIKEESNENIPVENDTEEIETDTESSQNNIQNHLSNSMLQSKIRKPKFASNIFEARKLMKIRKKMEKIERKRQLRLNLLNFQSLSDTKTPNEVEKENVIAACEIIEPSCSSNGNSSKEKPKSEEKKNSKIDVHSICLKDAKIILTKLDCDVNMKKHVKQEDDKKIELDSTQTEQESPKKILSEVNTEDENESVIPKSSVISKESWDAIEEKLQSKEIMLDYSSYDYETENDSSLVKTSPRPDISYSDDDDDCLYLSNTKPEIERYLERIATLQKGGLTIGNILDDVPKTDNTESSSSEKTIVVNQRLRKPNLKYSPNFTASPVSIIEEKSTEQNNKTVDTKKKQTRAASKRKITEVLSLDNNDIENENNNVTSAQRITDVNETEDEKKENAPEISLTSKLNIRPIRSGKRGKKNEIITASNTNETFVLPPSPESDVSASSGELKINSTKLRVKEQVASPVPKTKASKSAKLAAQRYSSDDLYKPRPMFGGTRRSRASLNNAVSDADLITPSKRRK